MAVVLRSHDDTLRAYRLGSDGIDRKSVLGEYRRRAGRQKRACGHVQNIVGAITQRDLVGGHAELGRQLRLQREAGAIGIQGHVIQRILRSRQRQRAGAKRVFVGSELDDVGFVQSQFARQLRNGLAGRYGAIART